MFEFKFHLIASIFILIPNCFYTSAKNTQIEVVENTEFSLEGMRQIKPCYQYNDGKVVFFARFLNEYTAALLTIDSNLNIADYHAINYTEHQSRKGLGIFTFNNQIFVFNEYVNEKENIIKFYASEIDIKTGDASNDIELFGGSYSDYADIGSIYLQSSSDLKHLLIFHYDTQLKNTRPYISLRIFDNSLEQLWEKHTPLPEPEFLQSVNNIYLDSAQNLHFVVNTLTFPEKNKSHISGKQNYHLYTYQHKNDTLFQPNLQLGENYLNSITLKLNGQNELVGYGFYSSASYNWGMKGFMSFKLDPISGEAIDLKYTDYSHDFLMSFFSDRPFVQGQRNGNFHILNVFPYNNTGSIVVAEEFDYLKYTINTPASPPQRTQPVTIENWIFGNIIILYLNANREITQTDLIRKSQIAKSELPNYNYYGKYGYNSDSPSRYWSAFAQVNNDTLYLIYNDNAANHTGKSPTYVAEKIKSCNLKLVKISPNSEIAEQILCPSFYKKSGFNSAPIPRMSFQTSPSEIAVVGASGSYFRFLHINMAD